MKLCLTLLSLIAFSIAFVASCGSAPQLEVEPPPTEGVDGYSGASPKAPDAGTAAAPAETGTEPAAEPAPDAGTVTQ